MVLPSSGFEWLVLHLAGGPFKSTAAGAHDKPVIKQPSGVNQAAVL